MFSYDELNRILRIDTMELCTESVISEWINCHIDDVLFKGEIHRSYRTGRFEIIVTIVVHEFVVALYKISDGMPDDFLIQSVGYEKALSFERLQA